MAKRRGNSEGSITQRADGRWMARLSLPDGTRKAVYGKTKAEAIKRLQAAQRTIAQGLPLGNERETVAAWLKTWLTAAEGRTRPRTAQRYQQIVRLHLTPRLGHIRLTWLTPADVERAMREAAEAGQSPQSVAHHRAVLRSALNAAMKHGLVGRNVAALADAPHIPEREYEATTPTKARAIFQAVKGDRLEAFVTIALACGLREGEALGARWNDVNLDDGTLSIQRTLQRIHGEWQFLEPKTKRSRRTISLPAPVVQALREHRARQIAERLLGGPAWDSERWGHLVFTNEVGGPLDRSTVLHHFHRVLTRAGLPKMRVHDLRHGAASLMAALGVPPRVAMEVLGHSQIATTMNRYTHVAPEWQREAAGVVAKGLWPDG